MLGGGGGGRTPCWPGKPCIGGLPIWTAGVKFAMAPPPTGGGIGPVIGRGGPFDGGGGSGCDPPIGGGGGIIGGGRGAFMPGPDGGSACNGGGGGGGA